MLFIFREAEASELSNWNFKGIALNPDNLCDKFHNKKRRKIEGKKLHIIIYSNARTIYIGPLGLGYI